jgi:hypothetical protein
MKVEEFKSNNVKELCKKLATQKARSGVMNHQFVSSVKWIQIKSCTLTVHIGKLLKNLHQENGHELGTIDNMDPSVCATKTNSDDYPKYE